MSALKNEFRKRLRQLRDQKKMTQRELADVLKVAESTISMYEQGKREPDYETLNKIADYFGVSSDWLLGRTNIPDPIPTIAFHRADDPMADLPEEARKSVEEFLDYIKKKYNIEDD